MTAQISLPSGSSTGLIALVALVAVVLGVVDIVRLPGWAWKNAEKSKAAYLVLTIVLPIIGLCIYAFTARTRVAAVAADGRAASLPFEQFSHDLGEMQRDDPSFAGANDGGGFGSFGAAFAASDLAELTNADPATGHEFGHGDAVEVSSTFFSNGSSATRTIRPQIGLGRGYRPKQRASLLVQQPATVTSSTQDAPVLATAAQIGAVEAAVTPTDPGTESAVTEPAVTSGSVVPAGWKADPTGRHQFRYWDGGQWTENVADAGSQSMDAVR